MSKTKWCPFCGSADVDIDISTIDAPTASTFYYSVMCGMCSAEGPPADSEQQAINRWNERFALKSDLERILDAVVKR